MPFYEYECAKCGHQTEVMQKISDPPLRKCPACGRSALKKLISAPVFRLKGSGWYETDFKSDKDAKRNLAEAPAGESGADAKAADKPAEKASDKAADKPADKPAAKPAAEGSGSKPAGPAARRKAAAPARPARAAKPAKAAKKKSPRR
jgi:putative FmdB family regulatory protein